MKVVDRPSVMLGINDRDGALGDAPMRRVVDENGPQQRLLGFYVGGRLRRALKIRLAQRRDGCLHRRQDTPTVASPRRLFDAQAVKGGDDINNPPAVRERVV